MTATFNFYHIREPTEGKKICGGKDLVKVTKSLKLIYNVIQVGGKYFFFILMKISRFWKNVLSKISPPLIIDVLAAYLLNFLLQICMPHPVVPPALIMNAYQVAQLYTLLCVFSQKFLISMAGCEQLHNGLKSFLKERY